MIAALVPTGTAIVETVNVRQRKPVVNVNEVDGVPRLASVVLK